jgi:hypothetical protein
MRSIHFVAIGILQTTGPAPLDQYKKLAILLWQLYGEHKRRFWRTFCQHRYPPARRNAVFLSPIEVEQRHERVCKTLYAAGQNYIDLTECYQHALSIRNACAQIEREERAKERRALIYLVASNPDPS